MFVIALFDFIFFLGRRSFGAKELYLEVDEMRKSDGSLSGYFGFYLTLAQHAQGELLGWSCVRPPLYVLNNFFKHLLLPNGWANLDQTWQECSSGGPL